MLIFVFYIPKLLQFVKLYAIFLAKFVALPKSHCILRAFLYHVFINQGDGCWHLRNFSFEVQSKHNLLLHTGPFESVSFLSLFFFVREVEVTPLVEQLDVVLSLLM